MIIKASPIKAVGKSHFSSLAKYIAEPKPGVDERVEVVWLDNFEGEDDWEVASWKVDAAQQSKKGIDKPMTYHVIVSFRPEEAEALAVEDFRCISQEIAESVGLGGHERITAMHGDTKNRHLHLAINLLDSKNRFKEPFQAFVAFKKKRREIEERFGFRPAEQGKEGKSLSEANAQRERHGNMESFEGWLKDNVAGKIEKLLAGGTADWKQIHQVLAENGAALRKRGAGFVLSHTTEKLFVKASAVSRELSMQKLTKKLGSFVPPEKQVEATKAFQTRAMVGKLLFDLYKAESAKLKEGREQARADLAEESRAGREAISAEIKKAKAAILALPPSKRKSVQLKLLTLERVKRMEKAMEERQEKAARIAQEYRHVPWLQWLQNKARGGDADAIEALQRRGIEIAGTIGNVLEVPAEKPWRSVGNTIRDLGYEVKANGTLIYKTKEGHQIIDRGRRIAVAEQFDESVVEAALKLGLAKYGKNLRVDGSTAWKDAVAKKAAELNINLNSIKYDERSR